MADSDEEAERLAALRTVRTQHTGAQFESGEVHRARGLNEPVPGVEVENGREEEEGQQWTGGRQNYATDSGRRRRLADTRGSKEVQLQDPRRRRRDDHRLQERGCHRGRAVGLHSRGQDEWLEAVSLRHDRASVGFVSVL